jgi:uncharacterized membrane protein HdeD (DUF308 family)
MFTCIGTLGHACCGEVNHIDFKNQGKIEILDMVIGLISLIAGIVLITQEYYISGVCALLITASTLFVCGANAAALVRCFRNPLGLKEPCWE